jgi:heme/copper-type cytochrome/quinol oxidase subunit 3
MSRRAQLGMAMFLIAEGVFFLLLILAFVYFQAMPHLMASRSLVFGALLLVSTLTMSRASGGSCLWLWTTLALGAGFLIEQAVYAGTTFFILAGIHGLHLLAGMVAAVVVPSSGLRAIALYWYFFAGVWLVVLIAVYFRGAL